MRYKGIKPGDISPLTDRQEQIILMLAMGYTVKQTAYYLGIAMRTVYFHLENAIGVTGCKSTVNLVATSIRRGWVSFMYEERINDRFKSGLRSGQIVRVPVDD